VIRAISYNARSALRCVLGAGFAIAGISHFAYSAHYARIIPPALPYPDALVAISGVCEIAGGIGVLIPRVRKAAGVGLIMLLIAVFPSNVYMALHPERFGDTASPTMLYARLPLQALFVVWVRWCCF
jgi:uncharacterized membrane protein